MELVSGVVSGEVVHGVVWWWGDEVMGSGEVVWAGVWW